MLWIPPPHWFLAVFAALIIHILIIGITFFRHGWKRGLLSIPVSILLLIISIISGIAVDLAVTPLDPLPLYIALGFWAYVLHALVGMRTKPVNEG